jgi:hypothetical protein
MKYNFITFATPDGPYTKDAIRLCASATAVARFDTALIGNKMHTYCSIQGGLDIGCGSRT